MAADDILDQILDECRRADRPVVVFDLDSTLFSTAARNLRILTEFAAEPGVPPAMAADIARLGVDDMGWNVVQDLQRRGHADADTLARLRAYWFERFFTNEYCQLDDPMPGAVRYCHDCCDVGATVYYLTGRDEPGMGDGTRASLRKHGFPFDVPHATLRLKPRFEMADLEFKREVVAELPAFGEIVGCFENEPVNANLFAASFPAAHMVFLETVHSPDPPPLDPRIVRRRDFLRSK